MKKLNMLSGLLLLMLSSFAVVQVEQKRLYKVLADGSKEMIETELEKLGKEEPGSQVLAYQGGLLMKKAGFEKGVKNKLKTFKEGAKLLEGEIEKDPSNIEYHFLRLTIQEHAPNILGYNKELKADKAAVEGGFDKLDEGLKKIVIGYAKNSRILNEAGLKGQ